MSKINCEVCLMDSSADSVMWKCVGCTRKFHAACVGLVVPRGSVRNLKKDKKADPSSFLLPCCDLCQTLVTATFEFNLLTQQQKQLADRINENTEVIHRINLQQEKPNNVADSMQGMEVLLSSIKNELSFINKNSSLAGSVIAIKNHITSLIDTSIMSTKENVKSATSELKAHLLSQLNQNTIDTVASCTMHNNSILELDILNELKILSASINEIKENPALPPTPDSLPSLELDPEPPTPDSLPSLEVELNNININDPVPPTPDSLPSLEVDDSGWRLLGTRKVWKADWSEYDARKLRRLNQQKLAEKAKKKKKQAQKNPGDSKNSNINANNRHMNNYNSNRTHSTVFHNKCNNHNNNLNNLLPPDRELLAAAKYRFSRPPPNNQPIQFQRGEILHPYPASDESPCNVPAHSSNWRAPGNSSAAPCEACSCSRRHSSFLRF